MNHVVDVRMFGKDLVQGTLICDIDIVKWRSFSADKFNAVDDFL